MFLLHSFKALVIQF